LVIIEKQERKCFMPAKIIKLLAGAVSLFAASWLPAETPAFSARVIEDGGQAKLRVQEGDKAGQETDGWNFRNAGGASAVKFSAGQRLFIDCPPPGVNNITLLGAVKVSGSNGGVYIVNYQASNLILPGYRLEAKVKDGKVFFDLLIVGSPGDLEKKELRYKIISSKDKLLSAGEWIFFVVTVNRGGEAKIILGGESVARGSVKPLEKDDFSKKTATLMNLHSGGDASLELAFIEGYYSLLSSVELEKIRYEWMSKLTPGN
jgi:hypothetical protein